MKITQLGVIFAVFCVAVIIHSMYFGREYFTSSPTTRTPLTKENVKALLDEFVLDYLDMYKKLKDLNSNDSRVVYRVKQMAKDLNDLNSQYPAYVYTINQYPFANYPGVTLEDVKIVKDYMMNRVAINFGTNLAKPADLVDLDQYSNRTRGVAEFVKNKAKLVGVALPMDFEQQVQGILTNVLQLKQRFPSLKPSDIPVLKSDIYYFMMQFAKNNFIPVASVQSAPTHEVVTTNLPTPTIRLTELVMTPPPAPAPVQAAPVQAAPVPAPAPAPAPVQAAPAPAQGMKFSELIQSLLSMGTKQTAVDDRYASARGNDSSVDPGFLDKVRSIVREEVQTIKMGPKDKVNAGLSQRSTEPVQTMTPQTNTDSLQQGTWFRKAGDGACPYANGQMSQETAQPIPYPIDMNDYIRKDKIPCWACTLK